MINAAPESHDTTFTHEGINYCIGYQADFDTLACSKLTGDTWRWEVTRGSVSEFLDADSSNELMYRTPEKLMDDFLEKVNAKVFTGDGLPTGLSANVKSLLLIIRDGLNVTSTGISRK